MVDGWDKHYMLHDMDSIVLCPQNVKRIFPQSSQVSDTDSSSYGLGSGPSSV